MKCNQRQVPTLHRPLLPECFLCHSKRQDKNRDQDTKGDPRPGEQGHLPKKAKEMAEMLRAMRLPEAAKKIEEGVEEKMSHTYFSTEHWTRTRTNNVLERLNREIRRRTREVGCFPNGNSALMLVCARLRHVVGPQWGNKKYVNMKHLEAMEESTAIAC